MLHPFGPTRRRAHSDLRVRGNGREAGEFHHNFEDTLGVQVWEIEIRDGIESA